MFCPKCGAAVSEDAVFCRDCGELLSRRREASEPHMIWYSILVYGLLYFSAVLNLLIGISYGLGFWYIVLDPVPSFSNPGIVYGTFPALRVVDIAYGVCAAALGIWQIVTCRLLKRYKKSAPSAVAVVYGAAMLLPVVYYAASNVIVGDFELSGMIIRLLSLAGALAMLTFNIIYFRKRRHLFVN